jgi:hypothetical protein
MQDTAPESLAIGSMPRINARGGGTWSQYQTLGQTKLLGQDQGSLGNAMGVFYSRVLTRPSQFCRTQALSLFETLWMPYR